MPAGCPDIQADLLRLVLGHACLQLATGRLDEALCSVGDLEQLTPLPGGGDVLGFTAAVRAWVTTMRAEPDAAPLTAVPTTPDTAAVIALRRRPDGQCDPIRPMSAGLLAEVALASGRPEEALHLVRSIGGQTKLPVSASFLRPMWQCVAAAAAMACGRRTEAQAWAERAGESAAEPGEGARGLAFAALARAHASPPHRSSRIERLERIERWRDAAAQLAASGLPISECSARLTLARDLVDLRDLDEAAYEVEQAKRLADACDAGHLLGQAVNVQRRIGACRPRPSTAEPTPGTPETSELSPREQEIARLVSQGMSNQTIARTLYISAKTVEAHLTRIYRKLNTGSRAALAALLLRQEADEG
jgi:DNA-binding CsgD family transcriptional regulator